MEISRFRAGMVATTVAALFAAKSLAVPASVTYTFEQFSAPMSGALNFVSPDVGTNLFHADFSSGESVIYAVGVIGGLTGNAFITLTNTLQVTLSSAVNSVTLAFAGDKKKFDFTFSSAAGTKTVASSMLGRGVQGGTLTFTSANPFTAFTLTSNTTGFAIDNLVLGVVNAPTAPAPIPESGATMLLLAFAVSGLYLARRCVARA